MERLDATALNAFKKWNKNFNNNEMFENIEEFLETLRVVS